MWLRWSEANDQYMLTTRIEGPAVVNSQLAQLMRNGAVITDPDCDLFAERYTVFPLTTDVQHFFALYGEATADKYALEEKYPGPCALTAKYVDGRTETLFPSAGVVVSLAAGSVYHDSLMGDIWYITAGGFCTDRGAPTQWCVS
jgi:hypothetical protein